MASNRWTEDDLERHIGRTAHAVAVAEPKSKYRNVKVRVDGYTFDSKHEAQYWQECRLREKAGEIMRLTRQVPFDLVTVNAAGEKLVVATYIADCVFVENGVRVVADTKGHLTKEYRLKRKWLALQEGIEIREVYKR